MIRVQPLLRSLLVAAGLVGVAQMPCPAYAGHFHVYHAFSGGQEGGSPSGVIRDAQGNLYGTTFWGGAHNFGTVFMITPQGSENVLYSFRDQEDGATPFAGLLRDGAGNLYGVTQANNGTVFKLDPDGNLTTLHTFGGAGDGSYPYAGLVMDRAGALFGTTVAGGISNQGTVYKIAPDGTETVVHEFAGGSDGIGPEAALIIDRAGNLYGMTTYGGYDGNDYCGSGGCGTVFKVTPQGKESVLYAFLGDKDGLFPTGTVARDKQGNLYGMTQQGGAYSNGEIFKLAPGGTKTELYSMQLNTGGLPAGGIVIDRRGNLYGTAQGGNYGSGVAFEFATDGTYTILHDFSGGTDGHDLSGNLTLDAHDNVYGATSRGGNLNCNSGYGCGTVFRIKH
jgi:uncharacterized repeat protein (TIGR03803 family)